MSSAWLDRAPRNNAEEVLQAAIWSHILLRGTKNTIAYAVPNGGQRSKATAGKLKAQGVLPGVADLMFILADGTAAAMELKVPGNRQSEAQVAFAERCQRLGVPYVVCYQLDEALAILEGWRVIKPEAVL